MHANLVSIAAGCHRHHYRAAHSVIMCSLLRRACHLHVCKQHWRALQLHPIRAHCFQFVLLGCIRMSFSFCVVEQRADLILHKTWAFVAAIWSSTVYARFGVLYSDRSFTFHWEKNVWIVLFAFVRFTRSLVDSQCTSLQSLIKLISQRTWSHKIPIGRFVAAGIKLGTWCILSTSSLCASTNST